MKLSGYARMRTALVPALKTTLVSPVAAAHQGKRDSWKQILWEAEFGKAKLQHKHYMIVSEFKGCFIAP